MHAGKGLIADPGLVLTIRNGANINKDTLRAFHDEILEEYSRVLSGEKNAMYRMKELWFYMSQLFTEPDKYRKRFRKPRNWQCMRVWSTAFLPNRNWLILIAIASLLKLHIQCKQKHVILWSMNARRMLGI